MLISIDTTNAQKYVGCADGIIRALTTAAKICSELDAEIIADEDNQSSHAVGFLGAGRWFGYHQGEWDSP